MQDTLWESVGCTIDTPGNVTCTQEMVPVYAVVAEGEDDVSKTVRFAGKPNLKLVVKKYWTRLAGPTFIDLMLMLTGS